MLHAFLLQVAQAAQLGWRIGVAAADVDSSLDELAPLALLGGVREPGAEGFENCFEFCDANGAIAFPPVLGAIREGVAYKLVSKDASHGFYCEVRHLLGATA